MVLARCVGWLIDNAMDAMERENEKKLQERAQQGLRPHPDRQPQAGRPDRPLLRHQFQPRSYNGQPLNPESATSSAMSTNTSSASSPWPKVGKKGGQYYTPQEHRHADRRMLQPFKGRVYDPAMGSGGFFVQSEGVHRQHGGKGLTPTARAGRSAFGQESNPPPGAGGDEHGHPWYRLQLRRPPATRCQRPAPDLRADYVMANPPFNMKEWWNAKLADDWRWIAGTPPQGNANFAWLQHMLYHLAPTGSMALLLANGSMSSNTNNEGDPQGPWSSATTWNAWSLCPASCSPTRRSPPASGSLQKTRPTASTRQEKARPARPVLFIDARQMGYMKDRVLRDFTARRHQKIADTFHAWQHGEGYENVPGFCYSASLDDIRKHEHVLTPGRYVGAEEQDEAKPLPTRWRG